MKSSVFGIPVVYSDIVTNRIIWTRSTKYDEKGEALKRGKMKGNALVMPIDFDFTQREYTKKYFDFGDVLSKLGGLRASIFPIFGWFTPFYVLYFLV